MLPIPVTAMTHQTPLPLPMPSPFGQQMYPPGGFGQQMFYGQTPEPGYWYQQQIIPGMALPARAPMPNTSMPQILPGIRLGDGASMPNSWREKRTLEEYEKELEEKRKAFSELKSEERNVDLDKDFESMQLLSNKKNEEEFYVKLGSNKDKRKEAGKEVKADKKVLNINEFLKHPEGEIYSGPGRWRGHGPGRGSGPDPRGHGGIMGDYVPGPKIEDQQQFPTSGSK